MIIVNQKIMHSLNFLRTLNIFVYNTSFVRISSKKCEKNTLYIFLRTIPRHIYCLCISSNAIIISLKPNNYFSHNSILNPNTLPYRLIISTSQTQLKIALCVSRIQNNCFFILLFLCTLFRISQKVHFNLH